MLLESLFTKHILEVLLIAISIYIVIKAHGTRRANNATRVFYAFVVSNLVFQVADLCMGIYRGEAYLTGVSLGCVIYIIALTAMAFTAYFWWSYVEVEIGSTLLDSTRKKVLWAIPVLVFAVLCVVSVWTGWIFTFDANGKYQIGSLFLLQYVFIFGYVIIAMIRSGVNFFKVEAKRDTDRVLLVIMLIDAAAVVVQLAYMENMMPIALVLTVLLSYMNVHSDEIRQIKDSLEEERLLKQREEEERLALAENNMRILALEEDFVSFYDVDLETGEYEWYVKDQPLDYGVNARMEKNEDFFEDTLKSLLAVVHPEDHEYLVMALNREHIREALEHDDCIDYYYRLLAGDEVIWAKMRIVYKDAEKKNVIIGAFNANDDAKVQQLVEQQQQLQEALTFTNYFLGTYLSAYYVDLETQEYQVYKEPVSAKGRSFIMPGKYPEALSAFFRRSVDPDDLEELESLLAPERIKELLSRQPEYSHTFRDFSGGTERVIRMQVFRGADESHAAVGFFDITDQVEEQLAQQNRLQDALDTAESANRAKTDFLFSMSHDIRTPMNAITGFTAMAKKYAGDEQAVFGYLDKIDVSGKQLLSLVNQVLEMARIESGQIELDERPVNVKREFDVMSTVLSEQAQVNGQELTCSMEGVEHFDVFADESRMSSIALNIAGNAMKYTPEGGRIDLVLRELPARRPGYATFVFTVADTGIGMSEEFQQHLFEPFAREKSSTVSKIQGTGLGLPIVKDLVDLMGGDIEVHSEIGKGTRFDITVDFRINDDAGLEAEEPMLAAAASFRGLRVLLVEDNELNREIALDILEEEGLEVEEAEDGSVAVEMLREKGPDYYDFILMDIQMPVMDGYEATRAIRAMYPEATLPIIAVSANAFAEDKVRSREAGMDDHVAKPINVGELLAALAKHL